MVDKNTHRPIFEVYSLISAHSKSVEYCRVRLKGHKKSWNNTKTYLNAFYWEIRWRHRQWNESHQGLPNSMKVPSTFQWEFSDISMLLMSYRCGSSIFRCFLYLLLILYTSKSISFLFVGCYLKLTTELCNLMKAVRRSQ